MRKEEILTSHKNYLDWLDTLFTLGEEEANTPYKEGKWSPHEIIMHLAEWDSFTLNERIPFMKEGERHEPYPDFKVFNAKAAARAHKQLFKETVTYAKQQRQEIIQQLKKIEEVEWDNFFYIGEHRVSIRSYFTDFIDHDIHHKNQISYK